MKKIICSMIVFVASVALLCMSGCGVGDRSADWDGSVDEFLGRLNTPGTSGGNGEIISGIFKDARDEQMYKWVKIGDQKWMARNLNFLTEGGSWCYGNWSPNCNKYGRLYDWSKATDVCPIGWHLPTNDEWASLITTVGGSDVAGLYLKATQGWNIANSMDGYEYDANGFDDYGFSALPGGSRSPSDSSFYNIGNNGFWWTATETSDSTAYMRLIVNGVLANFANEYNATKYLGCSVRCVGDVR